MTPETILEKAGIKTPSRRQQSAAMNLAEMVNRKIRERTFPSNAVPQWILKFADVNGIFAEKMHLSGRQVKVSIYQPKSHTEEE